MLFPKKHKITGQLPILIARLDKYFSIYIRMRDADRNGICKCVTCFNRAPWKEMDAGHFVSRDKKSVRWDPRNVHAQCPYCNRFRSGEQHKHGLAIDAIHGKGTAQLMQDLSQVRGFKIDQGWLLVTIDEIKKKINVLKQTKTLQSS